MTDLEKHLTATVQRLLTAIDREVEARSDVAADQRTPTAPPRPQHGSHDAPTQKPVRHHGSHDQPMRVVAVRIEKYAQAVASLACWPNIGGRALFESSADNEPCIRSQVIK